VRAALRVQCSFPVAKTSHQLEEVLKLIQFDLRVQLSCCTLVPVQILWTTKVGTVRFPGAAHHCGAVGDREARGKDPMQWTTDEYMRMAAGIVRRAAYLPIDERVRYLEHAMALVRLAAACERNPSLTLDSVLSPPIAPGHYR